MEVKTTDDFRTWLGDPDNWQIVKPVFDRANNKAIESHDAKRAERDRAAAENITELETENNRLRIDAAIVESAAEYGVEAKFIRELNLDFDDPADVAPRIEKLAATLDAETQTLADRKVNERLLSGHKPGSGVGTSSTDVRRMSQAEAIFLEELGELDNYLTE